ncbi:hypothetical protein SCHPADRAFT_939201 [Schizopora paradoxa]|uniref:Uncharacterized protein n=1 Tax=Schizopora paradoxa TaxID=27342 RepID=A0A0H2SCU4_9AGAM|nr:hypothetical protein SCHPADRAFT_939201 [Schizopora paradoxa]
MVHTLPYHYWSQSVRKHKVTKVTEGVRVNDGNLNSWKRAVVSRSTSRAPVTCSTLHGEIANGVAFLQDDHPSSSSSSTSSFCFSHTTPNFIRVAFVNMLNKQSISGIALDSAGLVALADLSTISQRTALTGSAIFFDIFMLAPGIHRQQAASEVNGGELPTTGAMTNGYVFRVENQGTVSFLQDIGEPGCLVTVRVSRRDREGFLKILKVFDGGFAAAIPYLLGLLLTPAALIILGVIHDFWAMGVLFMLMAARLLNVVVIRRRSVKGWKGAPEPDEVGDLLVLLSQDRWVRMRGLVDDLKEVTAGQWLRDQTTYEGFATSFATLLVYVSAALASNASTVGSLIMACLLLSSVALLGLCNSWTDRLQMFGCIVYQEGESKKYTRRLDMARELIKESGRSDWAVNMGLVVGPIEADTSKDSEKVDNVTVNPVELDYLTDSSPV